VVNIEENIKKEQAANPSVTPAELKAYFVNLYCRRVEAMAPNYCRRFCR